MAEEREQEKPVSVEEKTAEAPSLLDDIVTATRLKPKDEGYSLAKKGVEALMSQLVEPGRKVDKISKALVDEMIAEIDQKLSLQVDAVLHHAELQKLESAWRGLKYLVDKTDFRENIRLELLNVSKEDLLHPAGAAQREQRRSPGRFRGFTGSHQIRALQNVVYSGVRTVWRQTLREHYRQL
jgi:type VI secretion system protein ImpC